MVPDVLYVQDGPIVTGAGTAAGLDASLHLVRHHSGRGWRRRRPAGWSSPPTATVARPSSSLRAVPACDAESLGPVLSWIVANLGQDINVAGCRGRHHMSSRTFARRFRAETGVTPHRWLPQQRVRAAEELLELTDHPVEWIAGEVGFGNAGALRHHFTRVRGVSPQQYRRQFAC